MAASRCCSWGTRRRWTGSMWSQQPRKRRPDSRRGRRARPDVSAQFSPDQGPLRPALVELELEIGAKLAPAPRDKPLARAGGVVEHDRAAWRNLVEQGGGGASGQRMDRPGWTVDQ